MANFRAGRVLLIVAAGMGLSACEGQDPLAFLSGPGDDGAQATPTAQATQYSRGQAIEAEAPDVFGVTDTGLWDGRPSLGGVWVAYPEVADPERVIIRNTANGSSVIGALFRRERDNPGPRFQISSDAAGALNVLAGQPTELEVVALRKVVTKAEAEKAQQEAAAELAAGAEATETADAADTPVAAPVPAGLDPTALVAAALAASPGATDVAETLTPEAITGGAVETQSLEDVSSVVAAAAPPSDLAKPYIQIGIFSDQANAKRTETQMSEAGLAAETLTQTSQGKTFYRVIVGPAPSASARAQALEKVKTLGFSDAYFVTN